MDILGRLILVFLTVALVLPVLPEPDPEPVKMKKKMSKKMSDWNITKFWLYQRQLVAAVMSKVGHF